MNQIDLNTVMQILFFAILLWFITRSFFSRKASRGASSNIFIWFIIFAALVIIYAFRFELETVKDRVLAVLIPSYSWTNEEGQLVVARHKNGHFYVDAYAKNKAKIHFLVDTGGI